MKKSIILFTLIALKAGCISTESYVPTYGTFHTKQVLKDNKLGIDGLAGARVVELTPDGAHLIVTTDKGDSLIV